MSAFCLISGTLFRAPEQRTSKTGRNFVVATLRAKDGDATAWWKVVCFSESGCAELLPLSDGDSLSAQGALKVEQYEHNGETRLSLSCIADSVLALKQPPRQRERKAEPKTTASRRSDNADRLDHAGSGGVADGLNDAIPF
jgi:single-stranded DNA-binding protein